MDGETSDNPTLFPATVGERLRSAREALGLELAEVAARTRIPQRHLEAIESSHYEGLPSITYAVGFAKSYGRAVGEDEVAIARDVRAELGRNPIVTTPVPTYDPQESNRVPPRGLAIGSIIFVVLALIGVGIWFGTGLFRGNAPAAETLPPVEENFTAEANGNETAAIAPVGAQVSLIARERVWIRVSDGTGATLLEKELATGERYDVPGDANNPRIRTGAPERIQVTINGSNVPALGPAGKTADVPVSAQALQARGQPSTTTGSATSSSRTPVTPINPVADTGSAAVTSRPAAVASPTSRARPASDASSESPSRSGGNGGSSEAGVGTGATNAPATAP